MRRKDTKKKIMVLAVLLVGFLFVAGTYAADVTYFIMGGAGSQGRFYSEVAFLAKFFTEKMPDVRASGVVTPGVSRGNIARMQKGEIQAGRLFGDDYWALKYKKPPYEKGEYDIKAWFKCLRQPIRVIADIDIKSMKDLKGKKVGLGVRGSGDDTFAWRLLNFYGIKEGDINAQYVGRNVAQSSFSNHQLDAIILSYTRDNFQHLGPVFAARPLGKSSHFLAPTMEEAEAFAKEWPCYGVDTFGEPAFEQPNLVGIYMTTIMAVSGKVSEDLVYRMTKLMFTNWDEVLEGLPWLKPDKTGKLGLTLKNAMDIPGGADFHPGALRYYKEVGLIQ